MKTVSACLIVRNEESVIEDCLKSVKDVCEEIIIVDTGSTDKTVEICKRYTDKIYNFVWVDNYAKARNEWFRYATKDFILHIDADERLPEKCYPLLEKVKNSDFALWYVNIGSITAIDKDACISGNYRLFPNDKRLFFKFRIHENIADVDHIYQLRDSHIMLKHIGYLAAQKYRKGTDDRNIRLLLKCIEEEKDPTDLSYFKYLTAHQYGSLGEHDKSIPFYQEFIQFIKDNPANVNKNYLPMAYQGLAIAALDRQRDDILDSLLDIKTTSPTFYICLGHYFMNKKEYDKALIMYDESIIRADKSEGLMVTEMSTLTSKPYVAKGNAYREKGDLKHAIDCFRLAHLENPQDIGIAKVLSRLYAMHGKGKYAMGFAEQIVKAEPTMPNQLHLAEVYINFGKEKEGIDLYFQHGAPEHILNLANALSGEHKHLNTAKKLVKFLEERELLHGVERKLRKDCVTVIIPTLNKSHLFDEVLTRLNKCESVKEVLVVNNSNDNFAVFGKIKTIKPAENMFVNPAWNLGVSKCETDYFLLLNDDCIVDGSVIDECVSVLEQDNKFDIVFPKTETENLSIEDYDKTVPKDNKTVAYVNVYRTHCLNGWFIMGRKSSWVDIPADLKIFYGDNFIFDRTIRHKKKICKVLSTYCLHATSTTVIKEKIYEQGLLESEGRIYNEIKKKA